MEDAAGPWRHPDCDAVTGARPYASTPCSQMRKGPRNTLTGPPASLGPRGRRLEDYYDVIADGVGFWPDHVVYQRSDRAAMGVGHGAWARGGSVRIREELESEMTENPADLL